LGTVAGGIFDEDPPPSPDSSGDNALEGGVLGTFWKELLSLAAFFPEPLDFFLTLTSLIEGKVGEAARFDGKEASNNPGSIESGTKLSSS